MMKEHEIANLVKNYIDVERPARKALFNAIIKEVEWRNDCSPEYRYMCQTPWTVVVKDQKRLREHKWRYKEEF